MTIQQRIDHATETLEEYEDEPAYAIELRGRIQLQLARVEMSAASTIYHTELLWLHRIIHNIGFSDQYTKRIVGEVELHLNAGKTGQTVLTEMLEAGAPLDENDIEQIERTITLLATRWAELYKAAKVVENLMNELMVK